MSSSKYKCIVGGQFVDSESGNFIPVLSPFGDKVVGEVPAFEIVDVNKAFDFAEKSFLEWSNTGLSSRFDILRRASENIKADSKRLGKLLSSEIGKSEKSAEGEVLRSLEYIDLIISAATHMKGDMYFGDVVPSFKKNQKLGFYKRVPLGVVLAISPYNYPINLSVTKVIPALVAGNSVVLKSATNGSITSLEFYKHFLDAGLPAGALNVITGKSSDIGDYIIEHQTVKLIAFTGSTRVGEKIGKLSRGVPILSELGGKDTSIVMDSADLDLAADMAVKGGFSFCGQRCTATKRVLVQDNVADEFVQILTEKLKSIGKLDPLINEKSAEYVEELIQEAEKSGAKSLIRGKRNKNNFDAPTLLDNVSTDMRVFKEEQFGPVLPVTRVKNLEEAIKLVNNCPYGLQANIFTKDLEEAFLAGDHLEVGTVQINGKSDRGPDTFPFGGVGDSGQFMQGTLETLNLMTRGKLVVLNREVK